MDETLLLLEILVKSRDLADGQARECWQLAGTNVNSHFVAEARYYLGRVAALDEAIVIAQALIQTRKGR